MRTPETDFLQDFFAQLNSFGVRYAVMRNSETLPESLAGSDLDLFADGQVEMSRVLAVAEHVAKKYNGGFTVKYVVEATISCLAGRLSDGTWWGLQIDVFPGFTYFGLPYLDAQRAYAERILEKGSYYRLGGLSDIASFIKEILPNRRTRKDYYLKARVAYVANPINAQKAMCCYYGERGWKIIEELLIRECSAEEIACAAKKLERCLWKRYIERFHVWSLLQVKFHNIRKRASRIFNRPGFCVVFLGTDGSGKTTLINSIKPMLVKMLHGQVFYRHLRPGLLPSLASLVGKPTNSGPVTNPHSGKTAGWIGSIFRFAYYYIDYILGYYLTVFPMLVKRPSMVIFDRYYFEYMIDPARCAVKLPFGWARFWGLFVPNPGLIFCLGGDPNKIFARKPETSLAEVVRQVHLLKSFCEKNDRAVWIDTTKTIDESYNQVVGAILERMSARCG